MVHLLLIIRNNAGKREWSETGSIDSGKRGVTREAWGRVKYGDILMQVQRDGLGVGLARSCPVKNVFVVVHRNPERALVRLSLRNMMQRKEAICKLFAIKGIFNDECVRGAGVVQDAPTQSATGSST